MKMISLSGRAALLVASACLALACNGANAPQPVANSTTASPAANNAAPSPNQAAQHSEAEHADEAKMPRLSAEETKKLVDAGQAVIIDVRGTEAYNIEHIKGALDVHLSDLEAGKFDKLPKNKRIIAYCTWPAEHTSARAAFLLEKAGIKGAGALLGGMGAWSAAGYPTEKAPASPTPKMKS